MSPDAGTLYSGTHQQIPPQQLAALFDALCKRGVVKLDGTKVSYALPPES